MSEDELAKTIEEENMKKRPRKWVRNPNWWTFVISIVQLFIITIAVGVGGWYVNKKAREDAVRREVAALSTHLEDLDQNSYRPAAEALVSLGFDGTKAILNYAKDESCIKNSTADCRLPWQKARFFHKLIISVAQTNEDRKTAAELILSSWMAYDYDPGLDMEFYELLKSEPDVACPILLNNLNRLKEYPHRAGRVVSGAALLVLLDKGCPGQSSPQLEDLRANFEKNLASDIGGYWEDLELKSSFYEPWREIRPTVVTAGPFDARDPTWRHMTFDILNVFSKRSRVATGVMWHRLEDEDLPARLIFGQFILYLEKDAPISKDSKSAFDSLVELGLSSTADLESKVAAVAAVANLKLRNHEQELQRLADTDANPTVRAWARSALDYVTSSRSYSPPSELAFEP
jgi:hypothetical protein